MNFFFGFLLLGCGLETILFTSFSLQFFFFGAFELEL